MKQPPAVSGVVHPEIPTMTLPFATKRPEEARAPADHQQRPAHHGRGPGHWRGFQSPRRGLARPDRWSALGAAPQRGHRRLPDDLYGGWEAISGCPSRHEYAGTVLESVDAGDCRACRSRTRQWLSAHGVHATRLIEAAFASRSDGARRGFDNP